MARTAIVKATYAGTHPTWGEYRVERTYRVAWDLRKKFLAAVLGTPLRDVFPDGRAGAIPEMTCVDARVVWADA